MGRQRGEDHEAESPSENYGAPNTIVKLVTGGKQVMSRHDNENHITVWEEEL